MSEFPFRKAIPNRVLKRGLGHSVTIIGLMKLLFQKRAKGHDLVGHRWMLGSVAGSATKPYR
jgi:hypothetical protein